MVLVFSVKEEIVISTDRDLVIGGEADARKVQVFPRCMLLDYHLLFLLFLELELGFKDGQHTLRGFSLVLNRACIVCFLILGFHFLN
jgi:hypothetical protein